MRTDGPEGRISRGRDHAVPRVDEKDRSRRATRGVVPEREGAGYLLGGDGGAREARAKRNARVRSARGRRRGSRKRRARGTSHTWHKTNHSGVEAGPGELELDDLTAPIPRERRATTRAARRPTRTPRIIAIRSLRRALAVSLHAQRGGGGFDASGLLRRAVRALTDGAEAFGGGDSVEENDRASSSFDKTDAHTEEKEKLKRAKTYGSCFDRRACRVGVSRTRRGSFVGSFVGVCKLVAFVNFILCMVEREAKRLCLLNCFGGVDETPLDAKPSVVNLLKTL